MPSTFVNDLRLEEIATGEKTGTWGTTTNTNLELIAEAFSYGSEAIANASTHTITVADGTSDEARSLYLKCTGGGQACTVTLAPNTLSKVWLVENATSATLTFSQGSGANVAVLAGEVKAIATDGGGSGAIVYDLFTDVNLAGTTKVVNLVASGNVTIGSADISEAELEILDGANVTTTEINILDGDTSATSTTLADADRVVVNDSGTMVQVALTDFETYFESALDTLNSVTSASSLATVGTLNSGAISSGFGNIDVGSSNLTATGTVSLGATSFNDNNITNVGSIQADSIAGDADTNTSITFSGSDVITVATGGTTALTIDASQNVTVAGDLTVSGDDITMGTNTSGNLLIADGNNFNSVAVGSLSEISSVANDDVFLAVDTSGGGLKKITRSTIVSGLAVSGAAISNVVEDTTPQLGGSLDVNGQDIVSVSNGNITLTPNGSGVVRLDGNVDIQSGLIDLKNSGSRSQIKFYCESGNAHAQTLQAAPHSESASNTLTLPSTGGDVDLVSTASTATLTNKTLTTPIITEIDSGSTITLDATTDIILDADGGDVTLKDGGITFGNFNNSSGELVIQSGSTPTTAMTFSGANVTVNGNLTVSGTTTTVNSTTVNLNDHNIVLDSGNSTSAVVNGAGITIEGGSGDDATFTYNTTGPKFELKLGSSHESLQVDQLIANSLDIENDVDVNGTLEADAITVGGTALNTVIAGVTVANATTAAVATTVTISDNESTNENNAIIFTSGGDVDGGNIGLESDGDLTYNPSTGTLTATEVSMTTLDIGGTNVTATATELNYVDGVTSAIQTQLDAKASKGFATAMAIAL